MLARRKSRGSAVPFVQLFQATGDPSMWPARRRRRQRRGSRIWRAIRRRPMDTQRQYQYSMIRVNVGVIPDFRTALTFTLAALPEASSICPLPR
jgi:hypothetical protein